jgi:hypothetical protein
MFIKKIIIINITIFVLFFTGIVMFTGCNEKTSTTTGKPIVEEPINQIEDGEYISQRKMYTFVFDSCEYLGSLIGRENDICFHKGNCKYCEKRKKKYIREVIEEMYRMDSLKSVHINKHKKWKKLGSNCNFFTHL